MDKWEDCNHALTSQQNVRRQKRAAGWCRGWYNSSRVLWAEVENKVRVFRVCLKIVFEESQNRLSLFKRGDSNKVPLQIWLECSSHEKSHSRAHQSLQSLFTAGATALHRIPSDCENPGNFWFDFMLHPDIFMGKTDKTKPWKEWIKSTRFVECVWEVIACKEGKEKEANKQQVWSNMRKCINVH